MRRLRGEQEIERNLPVRRNIDARPPALENFSGNLLIEFVILDQQNRHALQTTWMGNDGFQPGCRLDLYPRAENAPQYIGQQGFLDHVGNACWRSSEASATETTSVLAGSEIPRE